MTADASSNKADVGVDEIELEELGEELEEVEVAGEGAEEVEVAGKGAEEVEVAGEGAEEVEVAGEGAEEVEVAGEGAEEAEESEDLADETDEITERLVELAESMFNPGEKNPYYLDSVALHNMQDLVDHLDAFQGHEGLWVAAWLEYLGDLDVAALILNWPEDFKPIVIARCNRLKTYHACAECERSD